MPRSEPLTHRLLQVLHEIPWLLKHLLCYSPMHCFSLWTLNATNKHSISQGQEFYSHLENSVCFERQQGAWEGKWNEMQLQASSAQCTVCWSQLWRLSSLIC